MSLPNQKPVIFLAFANEQSEGHLDELAEEFRQITKILEPLETQGAMVKSAPFATLENLLDNFRNHRDHIGVFHFAGHANSESLLLEMAGRNNLEANAQGLAAFFKQQSGLKLVFLNGCSTRGQVQALQDAGVGAVIATLKDINDTTARVFAVGFYKSLMTGASIQVAFEEAQAEIQIPQSGSREERNRQLYREGVTTDTDRFPWMLEGTPEALGWSLADALNDPTFGLPDLPEDIGLPQEPYRNLERFKRDDARVFFGRGRDTVELLNFITAKGATASPVVLLYGQTGVGKSSVLEAGVLPRLEASYHVLYVRRDPKRELLGTLKHELISMTGMANTSIGTMWQATEKKVNRPVVIILDQLDEAFPISTTAGNNATDGNKELETLLDVLQTVFTSSDQRPLGKIVLGFRQEVLANVNYALKQRGLKYAWKFLKSLDRSGIIEAIKEPAKHKKYNLEITSNVPGEIASDLLADRESPIAPTLQILMDRLWTDASTNDDPKITLEQYDALRKPKPGEQQQGGLLEQFFKGKIIALQTWQPEIVTSGLLLDLLEFHTTTLGAAKQNTLQDVKNEYKYRFDILKVVDQAQQERLLVGSASKDSPPATRLAHDTLGPLVQKEFRSSQKPGQRARRILENRAVDWKDNKRGTVLDTQDLKLVQKGRHGMRAWTYDEQQLVNASQKARSLNFIRTIGIVLVGAIIVAPIVILQGQELSKLLRDGIGQQLATKAVLQMENHYDRALLLGNQATQFWNEQRAEDSLLRALQLKGPKVIGSLQGHTRSVLSVSFSPDGKTLATSSADNAVRLWDVTSHEQIGEPLTGHTSSVSSVSFSPDGKTFATGSADKTVRLWDVLSHKQIGKLTHSNSVNSIAFSHDGKMLATGTDDKIIQLWDVLSYKQIGVPFVGHTDRVNSIAFSLNCNILASGSDDKTARFWDVSSHKQIGISLNLTDSIRSVAFSPDGKILATGSDEKTVHLWDVSSHKQIGKTFFGHTKRVNSVAFSPDGKTLATGSADKTARLWNISNHKQIGIPLTKNTDWVSSVAFSPDGKILATGSNDTIIRLWDISNQKQIGTPITKYTGPIYSVAFSHDGKTFATGGADLQPDKTVRYDVHLWNVSSKKQIEPLFIGHTGLVLSVAFSPDDKTLATGGFDNTIRLWNVSSHQQIGILMGHTSAVNSVVFSPNGKILATGSADKTARLWDIASRKQTILSHKDSIWSVAFSPPDGKILATGSDDGTVHLWNVSTYKEIKTLIEPLNHVFSIAFSPDGKTLATGGFDSTIRLWNISNSKQIVQKLNGHLDRVFSITFSPNGKILATGSADKTVGLWDISSRTLIGERLTGHTNSVYSISFSPDNKKLATSSADRTVRLWDISLESWRARACEIANRNLTLAEWRDSIGGLPLPYQRTCPDLPDPPDLQPPPTTPR